MRPQIVTFDLDSTLADTRHRHYLIDREGGTTDWVAYSMACSQDDVVVPVLMTLRAFKRAGYEIWIVSARSEFARHLTEAWLRKHGIPYSGIILDGGDADAHESHGRYKLAMIDKVEADTGQDVAIHVDDHFEVGQVMHEAGRACLVICSPQSIFRPTFDPPLTLGSSVLS